jgi:type II restriction enzyme
LDIVRNGTPLPKNAVRHAFRKLRPLSNLKPETRGWTLDVLRVVESLPRDFVLSDVYEHVPELQELHPDNLHVRDKVRQQLQVLRDMGRLRFLGKGRYQQADS